MPACDQCGEDNPERARFCLGCGRPLPAPTAPVERLRKIVTIVFSDVTGSTALAEQLDPESIRTIMSRCFDVIKEVLERHGGTVEKFIGDAVMAVFGIPTVHEDDALRAVRAVTEMQRELAALNEQLSEQLGVAVQFRTGVNTGEVVAGDPRSGQSFASGDPVNVAARLEQAAPPGQVLIGEETYRMVRDSVVVEQAGPLSLKGKREPVPAWRLVEVHGPTLRRSFDAPLVGREHELGRLAEAFERTGPDRCEMVTVLGAPGIGKSRLLEEFVGSLGDRATVIRGHCLSYGEGITFWPVQEAVREAVGIGGDDSAEQARARIRAVVADHDEARLVCERVAQALALSDAKASTQEIFWGIRKLFEALARARPLVVLFEDLHWAEPTFLDLVEYLAGWARGSPILLLCAARAELLEARPAWAAATGSRTTILLQPLAPTEADKLVESLLVGAELPAAARRRVLEAAEGNPLFVQEVLRLLMDEGLLRQDESRARPASDVATVAIPPTVGALLSARLDRLRDDERSVIQRASVVGKVFWWGAVADLSPESMRPAVGGRLQTLVRKDLIRPEPTAFAGEDAFSFAHILIRDAAYRGTSKQVRAELHERFAGWLERAVGDRGGEYEEILGYHLEQAYRLRAELGLVGDEARRLAERAAALLASAGRRALSREDVTGAAKLLTRAAALWPEHDPRRLGLLPELSRAMFRTGDYAGAAAVALEAAEAAANAGDRRLECHSALELARIRLYTEPEGAFERARQVVDDAVEVFTAHEDELGLARAYLLLGLVSAWESRVSEAEHAFQRALVHDRAAGGSEQARLLGMLAFLLPDGHRPVNEALELCHDLLRQAQSLLSARCDVLVALAWLEAMQGRFDESRRLIGDARAILHDLGGRRVGIVAPIAHTLARIEMLAGRPEVAESEVRRECELCEEIGDKSILAASTAVLAHALYEQGRDDDAYRQSVVSEESAAPDDTYSQVIWRAARAKVEARRGRAEPGERLAREAVDMAEGTDSLTLRADALSDLGEVLRLAGRPGDATAAVAEAVALYEKKGDVASAERARRRLSRLG